MVVHHLESTINVWVRPLHNRPPFVILENAEKDQGFLPQVYLLSIALIKKINAWRCMDQLFIWHN